jgi:ribosomal protein S12 methylthiotransferase
MKDKINNINIVSLGCAKNLVDSEIMMGGFVKSGLNVVDEPENSDAILVNTCGFLDIAREESVNTILEAAELTKDSDKKLIVMGCLSERYSTELQKEIPEVDRFFGTNDHNQILSYLTGKDFMKDDPAFFRSLLTPSHYAYLKIAEGCDNGCSFCSIPQMRGLQKSRPIEAIESEATRLVDNGVKEILIIAQDTTSYGWDLKPKQYLGELLTTLDQIGEPLQWIRLHYAHPAHLSKKTMEAMASSKKVCKYLDIPIQHASDKILKSMKRGLNQEGIRKRLSLLREFIPDIRLRTTLIVGYPGETDDDFKEICDFVQELQFDRLGIFTYSEEEGTSAAFLEDDVPREVKDERKEELLSIQNDIMLEKNSQLVGTELNVLIDKTGETVSVGRTEFDSPEVDHIVRVEGKQKPGDFVKVQITDYNEFELVGIIK